MVSETVHYKRGVSQHFSMPSFKIDFSEWKEEDVSIKTFDSLHTDSLKAPNLSSVYNCTSLKFKIYVSFPLKLNFDLDRGVFPVVIQAVVDEGDGRLRGLHNNHDSMSFLLRLAERCNIK